MESNNKGTSAGKRWKFDLANPGKGDDIPASLEPPGYNRVISADSKSKTLVSAEKEEKRQRELKEKRARDISLGPGKNLFMTAFMLWMSGTGLNIFTIMMTGMAMMTPVKAMFAVNSVFAPVDDGKVELLIPKLTYLALSLVGLAMGLYKLGTMGLLPISSADWNWLLPMKTVFEYSAPAVEVPRI